MNSSNDISALTSTASYPSLAAHQEVSLREVSHVFYCMQCDLQFQMDMAMTSRNGSHERDAWVVRIRLNPRIKLEREA
jgi:hypothetical protein